jgi:hypothetical protein
LLGVKFLPAGTLNPGQPPSSLPLLYLVLVGFDLSNIYSSVNKKILPTKVSVQFGGELRRKILEVPYQEYLLSK